MTPEETTVDVMRMTKTTANSIGKHFGRVRGFLLGRSANEIVVMRHRRRPPLRHQQFGQTFRSSWNPSNSQPSAHTRYTSTKPRAA